MTTIAVEAPANLILANMEVVDGEATITTIKTNDTMTISRRAVVVTMDMEIKDKRVATVVATRVADEMNIAVAQEEAMETSLHANMGAERILRVMEAQVVMAKTADMRVVRVRDRVDKLDMKSADMGTAPTKAMVAILAATVEDNPPISIRMRCCVTANNMENLVTQICSPPP